MTNIKTYNAISHKGLDYLAQHGYDINSTEQPKAILLRSQNLFDEVIPDTVRAVVRSGAGFNNIPIEIEALHIAPFTGIHLFYGEPIKQMVGFMLVQGIEQLHDFVKKQGWNDISEIQNQPWGGKECSVKTIDGSILTFFELA